MTDDTPPPAQVKPRSKPYDERPYVWCNRTALEQIQRAAGNGADVSYLIAAYIALCRLSSERGNASEVEEKVTVIAGMIGLRYRKTWELLKTLETIGVIQSNRVVQAPDPSRPDQPGTPRQYSILSFRRLAPSRKGQESKRMHGDANDVCTKSMPNHADSLKRKKKNSPQRQRQGGNSFSGGKKTGSDSKPVASLNGAPALNHPVKKIKTPQFEPFPLGEFFNVAKIQAMIDKNPTHSKAITTLASKTTQPCVQCGSSVTFFREFVSGCFTGDVLCLPCQRKNL